MDIVAHAVVGAAVGSNFNHPFLGAVVAVLPDAVLGLERKLKPNKAYKLMHSFLFASCVCAVLALVTDLSLVVYLAWLSHIALDMPTHCKQWAPRPLYPFSDKSLGNFEEWEFFNSSWKYGLALTIGIILICAL